MGFLRRQFAPEITALQFKFDAIFGVFVPVLLVAVDLVMFESFITDTKLFSYPLMIINILALLAWILITEKITSYWSGLVAGLLISGAFYASFMVYFVAAFALWGLLVVVALEGFAWIMVPWAIFALLPIFTAFVFIRNGFRALHRSYTQIGLSQFIILVVSILTLMFFFAKEKISYLY